MKTGIEKQKELLNGTCRIFDVAYSHIGLAPVNTEEHYRLAAQYGFPALKADVRMTKDGKCVTCHDKGFTRNDEGRIVKFDKTNARLIKDMTFDECRSLIHADTTYGEAHVTSPERFIDICRETGKIAYITLRDEKIEETVADTFRLLRKYGMERQAVINSFSVDVLTEARKYDDDLLLSNVIPDKTPIPADLPDRLAGLAPVMITAFFYVSSTTRQFAEELFRESSPALRRAGELGMQIHMAQVRKAEDRAWLIEQGITGFHYLIPLTENDKR